MESTLHMKYILSFKYDDLEKTVEFSNKQGSTLVHIDYHIFDQRDGIKERSLFHRDWALSQEDFIVLVSGLCRFTDIRKWESKPDLFGVLSRWVTDRFGIVVDFSHDDTISMNSKIYIKSSYPYPITISELTKVVSELSNFIDWEYKSPIDLTAPIEHIARQTGMRIKI